MRQYTPLIIIIIIIIIITILAALICMATCASGAETYYMPDDGTLHDCLAMMSGGDTLIIRDGVYTGDASTMDHSHRPPDGSLEADTTMALSGNPVISAMVSWMCSNAKEAKIEIGNTLCVSAPLR
ncbi:MAG: hypothetical protein U9N46_07245 [Euryarchaeota archaeon]|nr:hypothetical protein [Euryarchaeota archaeon]